MRANQLWLKRVMKFGFILMMGVSMSANAGWLGFGGDSWKEEVLLHDGRKIIVKRSQSYGGRHEIGQGAPIKEQDITFTLPGANQSITWTSEYSEDVGRANFKLLALHLLNGTPYIVASPNLCLSYNKWGRPNPPYVSFKYDSKEWQRIPLTELPVEFKDINVVIDTREYDWKIAMREVISAEAVKKLNSNLTQPQYKTILREAYPGAVGGCSEMIHTNDGWEGLGFFKLQASYEACLKYCERKSVNKQNCPCNKLFKGEK